MTRIRPGRSGVLVLLFLLFMGMVTFGRQPVFAQDAPPEGETLPQELFPDPDGVLKMFDADGNPVDFRKAHPITDPYNQNILKGDFPINGKHLYFVFTGIQDANSVSTKNFFDNVTTSFELFSGTTVFEPKRWSVRITPVFNLNTTPGTNLFVGYQEAFGEVKLADTSPFFDFVSTRIGTQGIKNDFEGFVYNDQNRAAQIFGTANANELTYQLFYADRLFKDAVSNLNTDLQRGNQVAGAGLVIKDIKAGLDLNLFVANNQDRQLNAIGANVNPINRNADLNANYFGAAVQGVYGRLDVSAGATYLNGRDGNNIRTGVAQQIDAFNGFVQLEYPINYWKPRLSYFFASGDSNPNDGIATGYDSINDASNFVGGFFSFFEGQAIVGTNGLAKGVFVKRANSLIPSLRNGNQPGNSVNPGLTAFNVGLDVQLHPKVTLFTNYNTFSFVNTSSFATFNAALPTQFGTKIGDEFSLGFFIRPGLADDFVINTGVAFFNFDPAFSNTFFGNGNQSVTNVVVKFTTTY